MRFCCLFFSEKTSNNDVMPGSSNIIIVLADEPMTIYTKEMNGVLQGDTS